MILTVDSTHHESYLCGIGSTGEMGIDLFGFGLIQRDKSIENVVASRSIIRAA